MAQQKKNSRVNVGNQSDDSDSSGDSSISWIQWFCSQKGNEILCEVEEDFIQDDFNLTGLRSLVQNYDYAYELILDSEIDDLTDEQQELVEVSAELLYGLIHARFLLTPRGMSLMLEKYKKNVFGRCPRVLCEGEPVLPCGQSDQPKLNTVKFFCSRCQELYYPKLKKHSLIDGAYFGTTFCHLFLQCYPALQSSKLKLQYTPKIYGFKIHPSARERQEEELRLHKERQQKLIQQHQQLQKPRAITGSVPGGVV